MVTPEEGHPKPLHADIIMVASAGNAAAAERSDDGGGDDCGPAATCNAPLTAITAPAAYYHEVLAVGATDLDGQIPTYSLSGPQLDVLAPGGEPESGCAG